MVQKLGIVRIFFNSFDLSNDVSSIVHLWCRRIFKFRVLIPFRLSLRIPHIVLINSPLIRGVFLFNARYMRYNYLI